VANSDAVSRRSFIYRIIGAIGGFLAMLLGLPIIGYLFSPLIRRPQTPPWIALGPVSRYPVGKPTLEGFEVPVRGEPPYRQGAWVVNWGDGRFAVYDSNCTHLGCPFDWNANAELFLCPCHGGAFTKEGTVVGGPPPHGLDTYAVRVENGTLYIGKSPGGHAPGKGPTSHRDDDALGRGA
jgi:menaquinol-cytochrome c reductase iron-sulfur subunit